jgi:hypothetical protein
MEINSCGRDGRAPGYISMIVCEHSSWKCSENRQIVLVGATGFEPATT